MSTPKLSSKHFASVAMSLAFYAAEGRAVSSCSVPAATLCRALGVPPFGFDDGLPERAAETLVFDLQRANALANGARYQKRPRVEIDRADAKLLSLPALLKGLRCIRYNCDGGAACGETLLPALAMLDAVIGKITSAIIEGLPEYDAAEWFI